MNAEKLLTHKDLADFLGVSETTIKSYRRKFPDCIPIANNGKPIRFTSQAKDVSLRIRDYFATGMSVEEVRNRLAAEFSWISAELPKVETATKLEIAPELTQGVSNMAKSMVNISSQQKTILQRVQSIENILEDLGLEGIRASEQERQKKIEEKRNKEAYLEGRLDHLDDATQELAATVGMLTKEISEFIRQQHEKERLQQIVYNQKHVAQPTVQPLMQPHSPQTDTNNEPVPQAEQPVYEPVSKEPVRQFLTYPLIVQVEEGQYASAGGRHRGRMCVNDLKAMLMYGLTPQNQFTLEWVPHGNDWWLSLKQLNKEENNNSLQVLLTELVTQRGHFVEVTQMVANGSSMAPSEFASVLDAMTE